MKTKKLLVSTLLVISMVLATTAVVLGVTSTINGTTYQHPSLASGTKVLHGVDVSYWNGKYTDWDKVKESGVDFVIMRIGNTYFADTFSSDKDSTFETNYANAKAAGLQVGVYYYTQAKTTTEAKKEAQNILSWLKNRDLDLPVYYDYEIPSEGRLYKAKLSKSTQTNIANTWMKYIEDNSQYEAGFYSYLNLMQTAPRVNMSDIEDKYKVWIAQYNYRLSYTRKAEMWQYSSVGNVNGMNGNIDRNFWYYNVNNGKTKSGTTSIKNCTITTKYSTYSYTGSKREPNVTVKYGTKTLVEGTDYKVSYFRNVKKGTAYALVRGLGKYSNEAIKSFKIGSTASDLSSGSIIGTISSISNKEYTGLSIKPTVTVKYGTKTLTEDTDYTVSYSNNINIGTATVKVTGIGYYKGTITKTFNIVKGSAIITTSRTSYIRLPYSSNTPFNVKASVNSGGALTYISSDETIAEVSNTGDVKTTGKLGSATITITSASTTNYNAGYITVTVTTAKGNPKLRTAYTIYSRIPTNDPFNLKTTRLGTGKLTYKSNNLTVATVDSNGNIRLKGNEGIATITVTLAASPNYYSAKKIVTLKVRPPKQYITSLAKTKHSYFKVEYKYDSKATGYQIKYSTNSSFTGNVASRYVDKSITSKTIKTYYPRKKYYVKVRSYKTVGETRIYGNYSSYKTVYTN